MSEGGWTKAGEVGREQGECTRLFVAAYKWRRASANGPTQIDLFSYVQVQMDKALSLPEIRLQICSQIASPDTLANLARTSTLFRDPALDWLWSGELAHTPISHIRHVVDPDAIIEGEEWPHYGMIVSREASFHTVDHC